MSIFLVILKIFLLSFSILKCGQNGMSAQTRNLLSGLFSLSLTVLPACPSCLHPAQKGQMWLCGCVSVQEGAGIYWLQGQQDVDLHLQASYLQFFFPSNTCWLLVPSMLQASKSSSLRMYWLFFTALQGMVGETGNLCSGLWHRWSSQKTVMCSLLPS